MSQNKDLLDNLTPTLVERYQSSPTNIPTKSFNIHPPSPSWIQFPLTVTS